MDEALRAREDFDAARFKAFRKAIVGVLTRRARGLASMDEALEGGSEVPFPEAAASWSDNVYMQRRKSLLIQM